MTNVIPKKLKGANMDIDLASPQGSITWEQDGCPWNKAEGTNQHRCAVKNVSICPSFLWGGISGYVVVFVSE